MKLLQINTVVNSGSTGRIAEDIGLTAIAAGYQSYIAAGYTDRPSQSQVITIGSAFDRKLHGLKTILLDRHGFGSAAATVDFIKKAAAIQPDVVHLHNIHGYYLHAGKLFEYLKRIAVPVIWTFHDCWPFTGHCSFFDRVNCSKWQTECHQCPNQKGYPASFGLDQSKRNFYEKQSIFNGLRNLQIVTPSHWLANHVKNSFLSAYPVQVIHNGVDTEVFSPAAVRSGIREKYQLNDKPIVLGVASTWDKRKGLADFIALSKLLDDEVQVVLVGLNSQQVTALPAGVKGIARTESSDDLAALYAAATAFINPTYVDNFPTTNIEALACGTPVITYQTGGSAEAVDDATGYVLMKGDITGVAAAVRQVVANGAALYGSACRIRAVECFSKQDRYADYLSVYERLLQKNIPLNAS